MYHIFFQPFSAVDAMKKGGAKAFALMLLVASSLASLAVVLFFNTASLTWMKEVTKALPWSSLNYVQYFVILLVTVYLANVVRAALLHLVLKIFTEKGSYLDAFKVGTVNCFLMSVYLLLATIAGAIPVVGMGLAVMVVAAGMLITISVSLKAISVLYKTDIVTACIAVGAIMVAVMFALHIGFFATQMQNPGAYKFGGPRMMKQWKGYSGYPGAVAPSASSNASASSSITVPLAPKK